MNNLNDLTIRELCTIEGLVNEPTVNDKYPLTVWHKSVLDKRISELSEQDIVRVVRNLPEILKHIIDKIIDYLEISPLYGYAFEGELIEDLFRLKDSFWFENRSSSVRLLDLIHKIRTGSKEIPDRECVSEDILAEFYSSVSNLDNKIKSIIYK